MGISNIERMVDALVRDEMNMVRCMSLEEMDSYVENLIRDKFESLTNQEITESYEMIGD
jgi:hypothetical protein